MVKLISVKRTPGERKEFKAAFILNNGREKLVRFGTSSNFVTNNKKTPADRLAYIARHRKNENWNNYMTPGSLSRWLLWEDRSLNTNVRNFRKRFKI
tara:strand:- start:497 stop:787 length:291 start_codon:yes stop_codon:yes gene_type:complete